MQRKNAELKRAASFKSKGGGVGRNVNFTSIVDYNKNVNQFSNRYAGVEKD